MPRTRFVSAVSAVGISGIALVALAGPAAAVGAPRPHAAPTPLTAARTQALRGIDAQRFELAVANWMVDTDRAASADKPGLTAAIAADQTSLAALRGSVAQDATVDDVAAHVTAVKALHVTDFVLPRVSTVLRSDDLTAMATRLTADETRYTAAIAAAHTAGKDVTTANAALADYTAKVDAMKTAAASAHATALPLAVADYPGNAAQLTAAQTALRSAATDLAAALRDVRALQSVHGRR